MMRQVKWMLCALTVCAICAAPAIAASTAPADNAQKAQPKKKKHRKTRRSALRGEGAIMVKTLNLSAEQQAKIKTSVEAEKADLGAWDKENGAKMKDLREQLANLYKEMKQLRNAREAIVSKHRAERIEALTADQQVKWRAFQMYRAMMGRLRRVKLTDEQPQKVRAMCAEACKAQAGPAAKPKTSAEARAARDGLFRKISSEVLTDAQRAELKKPRPKRKGAPGKAKTKKVDKKKPLVGAEKQG